MTSTRAAILAATVTLVAALATVTTDLIGVFHDDAVYMLVAKALAEGQGFVNPHLPGAPAAIHYPPLFPLLLAAVLKLAPSFTEGLAWVKFVNPVLLAGAAFGTTIALQRWFRLPPWTSALVVIAATVSLSMLVITNVVLSEPMFVALFAPTVLVTERLRHRGDARSIAAAAVLAAALILTRTVGIVVVGAAALVLLTERRWRVLFAYGALVGVLLLPWQLFVSQHAAAFPPEIAGSYGPYLAWVGNGYRDNGIAFFWAVLGQNLADLWRYASVVLASNFAATPLGSSAAVLAIAMLAGGIGASVRRSESRIVAIAFVLYLGIVLVWPFKANRFVWTLWPLVLGFALVGAREATRALREAGRPRMARAVVAASALLCAGYFTYNVRGIALGWASNSTNEMSRYAETLVRYVNADPRLQGKLLAAEFAPMVALYTGQRVLPVDRLDVRDHLRKKLPREGAAVLQAIDRRFAPDAYVLMAASPQMLAFARARFDAHRRFVELTRPGYRVRAFHMVNVQ